jgi:hypothetical protein
VKPATEDDRPWLPPGSAVVPIHRVYQLDEIRQAHTEMEAGSAAGKIVVLTRTQHAGQSSLTKPQKEKGGAMTTTRSATF